MPRGPAASVARPPLLWSDGETVLYTSWRGDLAQARIGSVPLRGGSARILDVQGVTPVGAVGEALVYHDGEDMLAGVRLDRHATRVVGSPIPLVEGVAVTDGGSALAVVSASGTLAQVAVADDYDLVRVDMRGTATPLGLRGNALSAPRYSPDGRLIALGVQRDTVQEVWLFDIDARTLEPVTRRGYARRPVWTQDGKQLLFESRTAGATPSAALWIQSLDGGSVPRQVNTDTVSAFNGAISRDGRWLAYRLNFEGSGSRGIYYAPFGQAASPSTRLSDPAFEEAAPAFSPDGRWLAYVSDASGQIEVYVRPFPGPGRGVLVSLDGGTEPVWSPDGRTLYYRRQSTVVAADIEAGSPVTVGPRRILFNDPLLVAAYAWYRGYDLAPDGTHFVMMRRTEGADALRVLLVHGWRHEVAGRLGN